VVVEALFIGNLPGGDFMISQSPRLPGREATLSLIKAFGQAFEMTGIGGRGWRMEDGG
jgi:hypothetical protein